MLRLRHLATIVLLILTVTATAQSADLNEQLRHEYQSRTLLLRDFYSSDRLRYDSTGVPDNPALGDWTTDGFIRVDDIHLSDDRLIIKGQRMAAAYLRGQFELRAVQRKVQQSKEVENVRVEIEADPGMHNPAPEQVEALVAKIFLTSQESIADRVPGYWKPCVNGGLKGTDKNCAFAADLLAIPGVAALNGNGTTVGEGLPPRLTDGGVFRVGGGVGPPRVTYQRNPEFSEAGLAAKFQGTVTLTLVVDKEGMPTHICVSQPLGYGLDAKAVQAVENWKFKPAEKDGMPVRVRIAVEVEFHLY